MDPRRLERGEIIAAIGGLLLALSIFLPAYVPSDNPNALVVPGRPGESASAWEIHDIMRWILLSNAVAPLILTYIIMRDHELSWPRGELTAVVGIAAFGVIFYNGILDRPGNPPGQIGLGIGFFGMTIGAILMVIGGALRSAESERKRKPPGVL